MKKSLVARGFIGAVASLLGVAAVGCGAETGGPEAQVGETSQDLARSAVTYSLPAARLWASSCTIHDDFTYPDTQGGQAVAHNRDLILVAAGQSGTSTLSYFNDWKLIDPTAAAGSELIASGTFGTDGTNGNPDDRRSYAKMIQIPGTSKHQCLLVGGENSTGQLTRTFKFTMSAPSSVLTTSFAFDSSLTDARSKLQVAACAGNKIIAVGGQGSGGKLGSIEVWNSGWTKYSTSGTDALNTPRSEFAMSANPDTALGLSTTKFVVVGGKGGAGTLRTIEMITTDSSCVPQTVDESDGTNSTSQLNTARDRAAVFPEGVSANKLIVAGGDDGSALVSSIETLVLNWTTKKVTSATQSTPTTVTSLAVPFSRNPVVTFDSARFILTGGETHVGAADESGDTLGLLEYIPGTGWKVPADTSDSDLSNKRVGHVAEYLATAGKTYVASGVKVISSTRTQLTDLEAATSP